MRTYCIVTEVQASQPPFEGFEGQRQSLDGSKAIVEAELEPETAEQMKVNGQILDWYPWPDATEDKQSILDFLRGNSEWEDSMQ